MKRKLSKPKRIPPKLPPGICAITVTSSFRVRARNGSYRLVINVGSYYIKNQQDATLGILFISHCKITLHVSGAFCVHHQEY